MIGTNYTEAALTRSGQSINSPEIDLLLASKAGFWVRAVAYLLDKLLISTLVAVFILLALVILNYMGLSVLNEGLLDFPSPTSLKYLLAVTYGRLLVDGIYFTFFHGYGGQTVGKMIMNLRVITIAGTRLSYGKAFKRWLGYMASGFILWIGYLMVAFTKDNQGLHDKIAGTYVIRL